MKKSAIYIAAGLAAAAAVYYWRRKKSHKQPEPQKVVERHHLTDVFSKAKRVAVGN